MGKLRKLAMSVYVRENPANPGWNIDFEKRLVTTEDVGDCWRWPNMTVKGIVDNGKPLTTQEFRLLHCRRC